MTNKEKTELQKEIVKAVLPNQSGRLLLAPRSGKTKIGIDIIKRDKPKTILWVTPSLDLIEKDLPREFKTWKAEKYLQRTTFSTWASLHKIKGNYELIILDEEQYITLRRASPLLKGELTGRIISMTGTPTKQFHKINLYRRLKLEVLYEIDINKAVDIGLLSNYSISVLEIPLSTVKNISAGNKKKRFLTSEKKQYEYLHTVAEDAIVRMRSDLKYKVLSRLRFIHNSISKTKAAKKLIESLEGKKLIFAPTIKQAEEFSPYVFHSKTDDTDYNKFIADEIDQIAMVNSGGIGHTYKNIDHLVITQAGSDRNGAVSQKIARTLLSQKNYKAKIWILCLKGTKDEDWVQNTLKSFDPKKITYSPFNF